MVSNSRDKVHQTWPKPFSRALYSDLQKLDWGWLRCPQTFHRCRKRKADLTNRLQSDVLALEAVRSAMEKEILSLRAQVW